MSHPQCRALSEELPTLAIDRSAVLLIIELANRHGPLMFRHDSRDTVDQPVCARLGTLPIAESDIKLGEVAGCEYWISREALRRCRHGRLVLATRHESSAGNARFVLVGAEH